MQLNNVFYLSTLQYLCAELLLLGKFWPEETEDKYCPNSQTFKDVSNQAECQDKCEAQSSCVGISYSHQDAANRTWCYVCKDDVLRGAANDFGFYRRPGKNKSY